MTLDSNSQISMGRHDDIGCTVVVGMGRHDDIGCTVVVQRKVSKLCKPA